MIRNAMTMVFHTADVLGMDVLHTREYIDRNTISKGMYAYDVRNCKCDNFFRIEKQVLANRLYTLILNEPIPLDANGYRCISEEQYTIGGDAEMTLEEYMKLHPPKRRKKDE